VESLQPITREGSSDPNHFVIVAKAERVEPRS
jgi:hypothetical protein